MLGKFLNTLKNIFSIDSEIKKTSNTPMKNSKISDYHYSLLYWLDCELFDVPALPNNNCYGLSTFPNWVKNTSTKMRIDEESRVVFMFQCHRAEYIFDGAEKLPNTITPKTYLAAVSLQPIVNPTTGEYKWYLVGDASEETIFNLAIMRTIFRKRLVRKDDSQTMSEWLRDRIDVLRNMIIESFYTEDGLSTQEVLGKVEVMNLKVADIFWPDNQSQNYIKNNSIQIDDYVGSDKGLYFNWKYIFQEKGLESSQIGPFFVRDLESCFQAVVDKGSNGLSLPLKLYLCGNSNQVRIELNPVNAIDQYRGLTGFIPSACWPSNPLYGLSLLQAIAVNACIKKADVNALIPVNGPPGTGKTTLLKEIIAHYFVERTKALYVEYEKNPNGWFEQKNIEKIIMQYSIVVASSNNKAVENISKELPSKKNIFIDYQDSLGHFSHLAPKSDWGLFCAVLGNKANRNEFGKLLRKISNHLRNVKDQFNLNAFISSLPHERSEEAGREIAKYLQSFSSNEELSLFLSDLSNSPILEYDEYSERLKHFISLIKNYLVTEDVNPITGYFNELDVDSWKEYRAALDKFKRKWFLQTEPTERIERNKIEAVSEFKQLKEIVECIQNSSTSDWTKLKDGEEIARVLLMSQPFGSESDNDNRAKLFAAACRLNEVMINSAASHIKKRVDDLPKIMIHQSEPLEDNQIKELWATLFLFFPVMSTSLASVESQFSTLKDKESIGLAMIDESGQAIKYHVVGLLQRSNKAILVGDPIQIEPVVTYPPEADRVVAKEFLPSSLIDKYCISFGSAQSLADQGGPYYSTIGDRRVGIPLLVHRRCLEPMFSIANSIAYDNKMVNAREGEEINGFRNVWIDTAKDIKKSKMQINGYRNHVEAETAMHLLELLVNGYKEVLDEGVYIITPFKDMERTLRDKWRSLSNSEATSWMKELLPAVDKDLFEHKGRKTVFEKFALANIGTVHTFQGKEAGVVIMCMGATSKAGKSGGMKWVNLTPNILNVCVTRAKDRIFFIGSIQDWYGYEFSKVAIMAEGIYKVQDLLSQIIKIKGKYGNLEHSLIRSSKSEQKEISAVTSKTESAEIINSTSTEEGMGVVDLSSFDDDIKYEYPYVEDDMEDDETEEEYHYVEDDMEDDETEEEYHYVEEDEMEEEYYHVEDYIEENEVEEQLYR
ncbi:MAG: hypothetical protein KJ609_11855 [Gammaproteobacteria bacterium]|nr:hypothetical protein [Gammaproteobacteria bacterium]MBU2023458.1 hypothetical protein [Gammaproteobacteria bacterium]MBU2237388.1 hypothetical protein [Gammaproteobacteria bacterium]MBU2319234.1 hypothetical protein [Gammaproteobacteria bacterium]MBU2412199.1 hypothetical protein [Gammaproteobacteria bacterium]